MPIYPSIKALEGELDELSRFMDIGIVMGTRKTYCHKCRVDFDECLVSGINLAILDKEMTSNWSHSKEVLAKPSRKPQMLTKAEGWNLGLR